jgi:hypothetical protein
METRLGKTSQLMKKKEIIELRLISLRDRQAFCVYAHQLLNG